jgi:pimeloyl-ACP methyl ester carboxylesterase
MNTIKVGDISLSYFASGTGEPIMFLHCTGGSSRQWFAFAEAFGAGFQVVAPDLCGYGATSHWPGASPFSLGSEAALVAALIDHFGKPMHVVGHSYGGAVALQLARRHPKLVKSLTVIEPVAFHLLLSGNDMDAAAYRQISEVASTIARAVNCGNYADAMRRFVNYWGGEKAWDALPDTQRAALASRINKVTLDFWATLNDPTRLEDFVELRVRTLILCGDLSPLPTQQICRCLAHKLANTRLEKIADAGHMLPMTHLEEVRQQIVAFVGSKPVWAPRVAPIRRLIAARPVQTPIPRQPQIGRAIN